MNKKKIKEIVNFAKECAQEEEEYKRELFSSIVTASLIAGAELQQAPTMKIKMPVPSERAQQKPLSARELFLQTKPSNAVEKTALFGYYLERMKDVKSFSRQDIISCFRDAKEPVPQNPDDKIQKCIAKGWMMKGEEKGTYTLTNSGITAVEKGFNKQTSSEALDED